MTESDPPSWAIYLVTAVVAAWLLFAPRFYGPRLGAWVDRHVPPRFAFVRWGLIRVLALLVGFGVSIIALLIGIVAVYAIGAF